MRVSKVCYPVNTRGTTWLRESDLVFVGRKPFVVLDSGRIALNPKMLKHGRADPYYRYEGEIPDPAPIRPPRRA